MVQTHFETVSRTKPRITMNKSQVRPTSHQV